MPSLNKVNNHLLYTLQPTVGMSAPTKPPFTLDHLPITGKIELQKDKSGPQGKEVCKHTACIIWFQAFFGAETEKQCKVLLEVVLIREAIQYFMQLAMQFWHRLMLFCYTGFKVVNVVYILLYCCHPHTIWIFKVFMKRKFLLHNVKDTSSFVLLR